MIRYVYIIFDHATDEFYIGSHIWHGGDDPKKDTTYMGSSTYWDEAPESCEKRIIKKGFKTEDEKYQYEYKLINQYFNHPKNVNRCNPVEGFYCDNSGENNPMYGKAFTKEHKKKMSESLKGKNHPMYGKHHTAKTRRKISKSLKKRFKEKDNPNSKPVFHLVTGKTYNTAKDAEKDTRRSCQSISDHCRGYRCKENPR